MLDDFLTRAALAGVGTAILAAPLGCFVVWRRMAYFGETVAYSGLLGVALGFLLGIDLTLGVIATAIAMALLLTGFQAQRAIPTTRCSASSPMSASRRGHCGELRGRRPARPDGLSLRRHPRRLERRHRLDLGRRGGGAGRAFLALAAAAGHDRERGACRGRGRAHSPHGDRLHPSIAVTVALAMKVAGILLITSLMIFPTAAARPFSKTPEQMAALAGLAAAAAVLGGLYLSLTSIRRRGLLSCSRSRRCSSSWPRPRSLGGAGKRPAPPLGLQWVEIGFVFVKGPITNNISNFTWDGPSSALPRRPGKAPARTGPRSRALCRHRCGFEKDRGEARRRFPR